MRITDNDRIAVPEVSLRIPGGWSEPQELVEQLPRGCRLTPEALTLADGSEFEFNALPADEEFPRIFAGGCPKRPTDEECIQIEDYKVNACLTGRGGSIAAAKRLMAAAGALLEAGGAGVFVDNSCISHGTTDWLMLLDSADDGGVYWAFVNAIGTKDEIYSIGMQVLGFRDAVLPQTGDRDYDLRTLHSFLGYAAFSGKEIKDGEMFGDPVLPPFHVYSQPHARVPADAPMFNPYGEWRLVPVKGELN